MNLLHESVQPKAIVKKFPQSSWNSFAKKGFLFDCYALGRQNVNNERYLLRRGKGKKMGPGHDEVQTPNLHPWDY